LSTVLVTGGSGFIGAHCLVQLLNAGHEVRTTVRSLKREGDVRDMVKEGGASSDHLTVLAADLTADAGWKEAVSGCDYVLHVASPLPVEAPKHEDDIIVPAREGTLRVLRAARDAKVKRVVLTSSFGAVGYGHPERNTPFDETSWTNLEVKGAGAYIKSKTLAERAAWDFVNKEGGGLSLSVINPTGVFGPVLHKDFAGSITLLKRMLEGTMPVQPKLHFGIVDVRDVADLHLRAMTNPAAAGERFIAVSGDFLRLRDIARLMADSRDRHPQGARRFGPRHPRSHHGPGHAAHRDRTGSGRPSRPRHGKGPDRPVAGSHRPRSPDRGRKRRNPGRGGAYGRLHTGATLSDGRTDTRLARRVDRQRAKRVTSWRRPGPS
jgi:dihydroflavonol-4-reductase